MDKNQEHYRDMMYDIIETNKIYTVVQGIGDEQRHRENALESLFGESELGDLFDI